jgi:L-fucose isomerase-like protein
LVATAFTVASTLQIIWNYGIVTSMETSSDETYPEDRRTNLNQFERTVLAAAYRERIGELLE